MTTSTLMPGLRAASLTPLGLVHGVPVYGLQGGRSGGGISFAVGPDDHDPDLGDDDDEDDDDDDDDADDEDEPRGRSRARRSRDDDDDDADQDDDGDDWTPPTRDQWQRVQGALKKANGEAGKRRRLAKDMDRLGITDLPTWLSARGLDPETGQPYGDDVVDPDEQDDGIFDDHVDPRDQRQRDRKYARDVTAAERRGAQRARDELVPILAQSAAVNALRDAGFTGNQARLERALRLIDASQLDVEMDGANFDIQGLDEQIEEIKSEFPEFFRRDGMEDARRGQRTSNRASTRRSSSRDVDGGTGGRASGKPKTWAEQALGQMNLSTGRRGR